MMMLDNESNNDDNIRALLHRLISSFGKISQQKHKNTNKKYFLICLISVSPKFSQNTNGNQLI